MAYSQAHRLPLPSEAASSSRSRFQDANLAFIVDHAKLNPSFEAYKLVQDEASSSVATSYGLPSVPPKLIDLYTASGGEARKQGNLTVTGLGYRETKERSLHQVLVPSFGERKADEPFAAYIDSNRFVVALTYDAERDRVIGHPVHRLNRGAVPMAKRFTEPLPSLGSISPTTWVVSAGGTVKLLQLQKSSLGIAATVRWSGEVEGRYRISLGEDATSGATIKACHEVDGKTRVLLQYSKSATLAGARKDRGGMQGLGFQRHSDQQTQGSREGASEHSQTVFEVQLIELGGTDTETSSGTIGETRAEIIPKAKVLWSVQGEEPLATAKLGVLQTLLGAEAPFVSTETTIRNSNVTLPQESSGSPSSAAPTSQPVAAARRRRRAPHFSWAQTSDTITIAFTLPAWITKSHIRAHFSLSALSLSFTQEALALLNTPASSGVKITEINSDPANHVEGDEADHLTNAARMIASGRYVSRPTWAEIDPTGSLWTVEKARGMSLLTLHLEKKHEGTRWMQVFADRTRTRSRNRNPARAEKSDSGRTQLSFRQARSEFERIATGNPFESSNRLEAEDEDEDAHSDTDAEDNEDDVPETMDPSELLSMLEGMQKYTVDEETVERGNGYGLDRTGFDASGGHGQNGGTSLSMDQPSLLKDSLEEEDANVGRTFVISSIHHAEGDGDRVEILTSSESETTVLATSLPNANTEEGLVAIKHDLDGAVFASTSEGWEHVATMPALAFVLASKRDAQRVHIYKRQTIQGQEAGYVVLAFESAPQVTGSGSRGGGGDGSASGDAAAAGAGNLFLYYSPSSTSAKHAQSRVVRLGAATSAADSADTNYDCEDKGEGANGSASGALLGVCSVRLARKRSAEADEEEKEKEEETLMCLCENRILLLRGLV